MGDNLQRRQLDPSITLTHTHYTMNTTPTSEGCLAAAIQLEGAVEQLHALAQGKQIPNAFHGIWEDEPKTVSPNLKSIARQIRNAQILLGIVRP